MKLTELSFNLQLDEYTSTLLLQTAVWCMLGNGVLKRLSLASSDSEQQYIPAIIIATVSVPTSLSSNWIGLYNCKSNSVTLTTVLLVIVIRVNLLLTNLTLVHLSYCAKSRVLENCISFFRKFPAWPIKPSLEDWDRSEHQKLRNYSIYRKKIMYVITLLNVHYRWKKARRNRSTRSRRSSVWLHL